MIRGVKGLARDLIDDNPFGAAGFSRHFRMDVIFTIAAARKGAFAIEKRASSDISRQWLAMPLFQRL